LAKVDDGAGALALDALERQVELVPAIAPQRVKRFPCQTFAVHANQQIFGAFDVPGDDGEVLLVSTELAIHDDPERAEARGQVSLGVSLHGRFVLARVAHVNSLGTTRRGHVPSAPAIMNTPAARLLGEAP